MLRQKQFLPERIAGTRRGANCRRAHGSWEQQVAGVCDANEEDEEARAKGAKGKGFDAASHAGRQRLDADVQARGENCRGQRQLGPGETCSDDRRLAAVILMNDQGPTTEATTA